MLLRVSHDHLSLPVTWWMLLLFIFWRRKVNSEKGKSLARVPRC
jgi:hypothetical protein